MNECLRCHTPLPVDGRFCSNCGAPQELAHVCPPDPVQELQDRLSRTLAGRYEITQLLGRGGMAVVFLAKELGLERQVAIKVLPPDMSLDTKLIPRFQQEAKTAAKLDHPNIIPIYRVESEAGLDYFVMKYVTGQSLDQMLEKGPLPLDLARRVLREAALALGHAHKRGIVHRDVKPANIMLENDGRVILTDFGISKALEGGSGFTGTGAIIGTPHYMAPEQAKGLEVDGRADQYSLGVVGYQILTGKQPFEGSSHSILYKHVFEPAPRVFETRPDAPPDLAAALDRALSKEPEKRFASMEEFASAVSGDRARRRSGQATLVSAPVKPLTQPGPPTASRPKGSSRLVSRSIMVVGLCAAIGGAAWAGLNQFSVDPDPLVPEIESPAPRARSATVLPKTTTPPAVSGQQPAASAGTSAPEIEPAASKPKPAPKQYALLTVASEPWGTLYIDGVEIGPTPVADHRLELGTYRLRIEQEGFRTKIETIVVRGPNPIRRRYSLEPAGPE
ncbi:MAG TPA: protein kinase [Gemmatimonadales bacterium]